MKICGSYGRVMLKTIPTVLSISSGSNCKLREVLRPTVSVALVFSMLPSTLRFLAAPLFFWCTSRDDTFPSVVLEAMHRGVPAAAFAGTGGVDVMLSDGRGALVEGFSVLGLADVTRSILRREASGCTERARRWVTENLEFPAYVSWLLIGCSKLFESLLRYLSQKYPSLARNWGCRIKQLNIIFTIYLSPEDANKEDLQILSAKEALLLSLALSLDSILVGMAFTAVPVSWPLFLLLAMFFNLLLFAAGYLLGRLLCHMLHIDLSWLSGLFLLLLAVHALS